MDRDIYLILIGAGISLASSIVTLLLQFLLNIWNERIRAKREGKEIKMREIRKALLDKSEPVRFRPEDLMGSLIPPSSDGIEVELDIPSFLQRKNVDGEPEPIIPVTASQFWGAIGLGVLVFFLWNIVSFSEFNLF
jgi:hypothetical protein